MTVALSLVRLLAVVVACSTTLPGHAADATPVPAAAAAKEQAIFAMPNVRS